MTEYLDQYGTLALWLQTLIALAALVAVGIVVGLLLRGFPVRQAVGGPPLTASQNGDGQ
mgnify:CR=1 FL=1